MTRENGIQAIASIVLATALTLLSACASGGGAPRPPARPIGALLIDLERPEPEIRAMAAWTLAGAPGTDVLVKALERATEDDDRRVRYAAVWAWTRIAVVGGAVKSALLTDVAPRPIHITQPVYPPELFARRVEGTVEIDILIGELGEVAHAEVRKSHSGLDDAALTCVRQWTFTPAMRKGKPVATIASAPITFRIF